ncbi:glycosyltransferase family 39 protein [Actinopolymorpha pittospori]
MTARRTSFGRTRLDPATVTLVLVVTVGIALRVGLWWQGRAFWRDELALVQSLDAFSPSQLVGPLADAQSAPPLWLLLVRAVTAVAGDGERAYRLVALGCGCATLILLALLAARLVRRRWAAVVPVILLATISQLVFYTAQTKQYTADTLLVTWLLLLATYLLPPRRSDPPGRTGDTRDSGDTGDSGQDDARSQAARWLGVTPPEVAWYASLLVLPWFSHGFMLCAPFVAGWVSLLQLRRRDRGMLQLAGWLAVPALSVLAAALYSRHLTSQVSDFATYWAAFFGPVGAGVGRWVDWHGYVFGDLALRELGFRTVWGLLLLVAGFVVAWRRRPAVAVLLVLPLVAAYVVGVLGIYPFGRRLVLFCVPGLLVYLGVLVDGAAGWVGRFVAARWPAGWPVRQAAVAPAVGIAAALAVLAICWTPPGRLSNDLRYLYGVDDYRAPLEFVADRWKAGDVLVVGNGDRTAVRVYGPRLGLPPEQTLRAFPTTDETPRARCALPEKIRTARRVWLVTGDVVPVYEGPPSRYAVVAPMLPTHRIVWQRVQGLVTIQVLLPGSAGGARPARCLDYAPVGPAGAPGYPTTLLPVS